MRQQVQDRGVISRDRYDAVLFDLDGVITNTAKLHAACWKQMFDEYLQKRATERGEAFRPFDLSTDYRLYLDGKPRFDGVRDFLASRGIRLPEGDSDDPPKPKRCLGLVTARLVCRQSISHSWLGNLREWLAHRVRWFTLRLPADACGVFAGWFFV